MLTSDRKRLVIFERGIAKNQTLLKHTKELKKYNGQIEFVTSSDITLGSVSFGRNRINKDSRADLWDGIDFPVRTSFRNKFHEKTYHSYLKVRRFFSKKKQAPTEFFAELKENTDEFSNLEEHVKFIKDKMDILQRSGQIDTMLRFKEKLNLIESEIALRDGGFKHYVTEENIVKFVLKSVRGLKLDYILKFDRLIPEDVVATKDKAEELMIFDNYVILHYDPESAELLKNEVQATEEKKDPILFGLIEGSNKLYFIDDWIDEHCDLTFSKLIESIGQDDVLE
jgi:hypothetical protein